MVCYISSTDDHGDIFENLLFSQTCLFCKVQRRDLHCDVVHQKLGIPLKLSLKKVCLNRCMQILGILSESVKRKGPISYHGY